MGLFGSLKGHQPENIGEAASNSSPPAANNPFRWQRQPFGASTPSNQGHNDEYRPPPGPPPSHQTNDSEYQPPPGPPPSHQTNESEFQPPPGPPPSHAGRNKEKEEAHQPPPPSYVSEPYHDWTAIPDTALLPPPPSLSNKYSPTSNAEEADAIRAHQWCELYPLMRPKQPTSSQIAATHGGILALHASNDFRGKLVNIAPGVWRGSTKAGSKDCCLLSSLPLYFAMVHSPFRTETSKTIYFEVRCISLGARRGENENSLAIGYCAVPYPTWRMPGWERGSLGVHSDDGRRYVNDTEGGVDFTSPFLVGETIGLGVTFSVPNGPPDFSPSPSHGEQLKGEVFLIRNGKREGSWNIHEELDSESEFGVFGVDGQFDLFGAVGIFGEAAFEVSFNSEHWLGRPP